MGSINEVPLWQETPTGTSPATLFTATLKTMVKTITVANISPAPANFSMYIDQSGSDYSSSKAIIYNVQTQPGSTWICDSLYVLQPGATVGFQTNISSAFAVGGYGAEILP